MSNIHFFTEARLLTQRQSGGPLPNGKHRYKVANLQPDSSDPSAILAPKVGKDNPFLYSQIPPITT